jgi:CheY-like chemotaxis protein
VITDLIMPEIDGWQLLELIKSDPNKSNIRVFVSTAEPMLLEEKSDHKYKFDGIVSKPHEENDIVKAILGR